MNGYNKELRGKKEVVTTEDGSKTLYSSEFDECYHSTRDGALQESLQKHVVPAFRLLGPREQVTILDICFGLGYNTLATLYYLHTQKLANKVHIYSPEFDETLVRSLASFEYPGEFDTLRPAIEALSRDLRYDDGQVSVEVLLGDARQSIPGINQPIDIVYQDAFSPKKNPLLWTREYFADIRAICSEDVIMTTYSVATPVRMGLYENGFLLFEPPSTGVRNGTIAALRELPLKPIDMMLKMERNPQAASLKDSDFI